MRGTQIARFGTTPGGHLGDHLANHIGGSRTSSGALHKSQSVTGGRWLSLLERRVCASGVHSLADVAVMDMLVGA
jgi:hypothetical protein